MPRMPHMPLSPYTRARYFCSLNPSTLLTLRSPAPITCLPAASLPSLLCAASSAPPPLDPPPTPTLFLCLRRSFPQIRQIAGTQFKNFVRENWDCDDKVREKRPVECVLRMLCERVMRVKVL